MHVACTIILPARFRKSLTSCIWLHHESHIYSKLACVHIGGFRCMPTSCIMSLKRTASISKIWTCCTQQVIPTLVANARSSSQIPYFRSDIQTHCSLRLTYDFQDNTALDLARSTEMAAAPGLLTELPLFTTTCVCSMVIGYYKEMAHPSTGSF